MVQVEGGWKGENLSVLHPYGVWIYLAHKSRDIARFGRWAVTVGAGATVAISATECTALKEPGSFT